MTNTVIMPQLGETVAEGKILQWFKAVGDEITEGDNLFEVETDKVTIEVQSILSGRLNEIRVSAGTIAKVGDVVATIGGAATLAAPKAVETPVAGPPLSKRSPFEEVSTPTENFGPAKGPDAPMSSSALRVGMVPRMRMTAPIVPNGERSGKGMK